MNADEAKKLSVDELIGKLSSNKGGLTSQEAQKRLLEFGPNAILGKKN
jgi:Cation transporter/ATPase, N-terminus.